MSVPLTPSADKNWITTRCLEESKARSLTVISLLFQSTTHCRYWVYTKFLLTYTDIYRRNHKVLPLGITALQPQSHFHLGTPYSNIHSSLSKFESDSKLRFNNIHTLRSTRQKHSTMQMWPNCACMYVQLPVLCCTVLFCPALLMCLSVCLALRIILKNSAFLLISLGPIPWDLLSFASDFYHN